MIQRAEPLEARESPPAKQRQRSGERPGVAGSRRDRLAGQMLTLQRTIGNRSTQRWFESGIGRDVNRRESIAVHGAKAVGSGTALERAGARPLAVFYQPRIQKQNDERQSCGPLGGTQVSDLYQLLATGGSTDYPLAIIGRRGELPRYAKVYHLGDWLNDEMVIVEIPRESISVVVIHCDHQEILEADPRELPCAAPEITVHVENGRFGAGTVKIAQHCQEVCFESEDKLKPRLVYTLDAGAGLWILQDGKDAVTAYPPSELEGLLGVHLEGEKCGEPKTENDVVDPAQPWRKAGTIFSGHNTPTIKIKSWLVSTLSARGQPRRGPILLHRLHRQKQIRK